MCIGGAPSTPPVPPAPEAPPPAPTPQDPRVTQARQVRRQQAALGTGGRQSTILTSALGLTTSATSGARKTLLGQ